MIFIRSTGNINELYLQIFDQIFDGVGDSQEVITYKLFLGYITHFIGALADHWISPTGYLTSKLVGSYYRKRTINDFPYKRLFLINGSFSKKGG